MTDATHQQKHQAGRHLVAAQALLRGYQATVVGPNSYVEINGHKTQVQVAALGAWQIADVQKYLAGTIGRVVLVNVADTAKPEFFAMTGDEIRDHVRRQHEDFMARVGERPRNPESQHAAIKGDDVWRWEANWSIFA